MAYWALKTRESKDIGEGFDSDADKWNNFVREKVIAIGWKKLDIPLNEKTSKKQIQDALKQRASKKNIHILTGSQSLQLQQSTISSISIRRTIY